MRHFLVLFVYIFLFSEAIYAQETNISVELRPRFEYRNGYRGLAEKDGGLFAVTQRSGLTFDHSRDKLTLKFTLRDVRTWGETQTLQKQNNLTTVAQAWAEIKMNSTWSVRVGRQPLKYMGGHILGTNNWNQLGRFHDAVLLKMESDSCDFDFHFGAAYNNNTNVNDDENDYYTVKNTYKALAMAYAKKDFGQLRTELLYLANGYQDLDDTATVNYTHTGGIRLMRTKGAFRPEAIFYYQGGFNRDGTDVRAFMASLKATYQANEKWSFQLGSDYISGQDYNQNSSVDHRFDLLYGFRHKYYGHMDYFYIGGNTNYGLGFSDTYFKADYKVNSKWNIYGTVHQFVSGNKIEDVNTATAYSSNLGTELDLGFSYKMKDFLKIVGGYSQMFASESLGFLEGSTEYEKMNNWVWIQLNVTPTIFSWKKETVPSGM